MELQSGRRLRSPPCPGGGADHLSSLHDDILLQVLVHLNLRDAARASLLSRRWRGLWTQLRHYIFRDFTPSEILRALASLEAAAVGQPVSLIDIHTPTTVDFAWPNSLLRAAAALSPAELVLTLPCPSQGRKELFTCVYLPCFHRAASIKIDVEDLHLTSPLYGEFLALERLDLSGNIVDVGAIVRRCPRLRVLNVTFRGAALRELEEALASLVEAAAVGHAAVSLLGIDIPKGEGDDAARINSLLCSAARLSPEELVFIIRRSGTDPGIIELPCFHRITSIKIDIQHLTLTLTMPPAGDFPALEKLSLSARSVDIGTLLDRCARLRVLKVTKARTIPRVHSASLQELNLDVDVHGYKFSEGIDVVTPVLQQLTLKVTASINLSVSILAPMAKKKVSWQCSYHGWLAFVSVDPLDAELINFAQEEEECVEKVALLCNDLERHLKAMGHVLRSILLHLLAVVHVSSTATKRIKVVLKRFKNSEVSQPCLGGSGNCVSCEEPSKDLMRSIISALNQLEEVEIEGFQGEDSEFGFLTLIIGCTPMLKRLTVTLSPQIKAADNCYYKGLRKKLTNSLSAMHPSVTYHVYLYTGKLVMYSCLECSQHW